jgi:hypothetical protein
MVYRYRFYAACAAFLFILLALPHALSAQSWQWANVGSGSQNDLVGGVGVDSAGNTYAVGTFENNIAFGSTIFTNGFNTGMFLVKYNPGGALQWALQANGVGNVLNPGIAVSRDGEVFVTAGFNGFVHIGPDTVRSSGGYDAFVARISPAGTVRWMHRDGVGVGDAYARGVAVDATLNCYITGFYADTARFDTFTVKSNGLNDIFIAKFDPNGVLQWASSTGGPRNDEASGIGVDPGGSSYITGRFSDSTFFGADTVYGAGGTDIFVAKFSDIGIGNWITPMGGPQNDAAYGIAVDQFGNSFVVGSFADTAFFGDTIPVASAGGTDMFLSKVDGVGSARWTVTGGGVRNDAAYGATVDALGTVYITGTYADTARIGSDTLIDSAATGDVFVAKYDGTGGYQWVRHAGGVKHDEGRSVAIDRGGELRVRREKVFDDDLRETLRLTRTSRGLHCGKLS